MIYSNLQFCFALLNQVHDNILQKPNLSLHELCLQVLRYAKGNPFILLLLIMARIWLEGVCKIFNSVWVQSRTHRLTISLGSEWKNWNSKKVKTKRSDLHYHVIYLSSTLIHENCPCFCLPNPRLIKIMITKYKQWNVQWPPL